MWRPPEHKPTESRQQLGDKPLIDLTRLQGWLGRSEFDVEYDLWVATRKCDHNLEALGWSHAQLVRVIRTLRTADYHRSEWCETEGGWYPCDAYRIEYDEARGQRKPGAVRFYVKFSLDDSGDLVLVLVSAHMG